MTRKNRTPTALASVALLSVAMMAGCMGGLLTDDAVEPVLAVDRDRAWTGEDVTFDAQASRTDGEIISYRFDFGDGESFETDDVEQARVTHSYSEGGVYTAVLTVVAELPDGETREAETEAQVNIDHRVEVTEVLLSTATQPEADVELPVRAGGYQIDLELSIDNRLPVGSSTVTVRLVDPTGEILLEEQVSADSSNATFEASVPIELTGLYSLEFEVDSGAVGISGSADILYQPAEMLDF